VPLADLEPQMVYEQALGVRPLLSANQLRYQAATKQVEVAKAGMYPTLSAFANLQSAFSSALAQVPKGANITTVIPTAAFVNVGGTNYFVNSPVSRPQSFEKATIFRQFGYNFRQGLGLSLQVPIFNGHQARTQWKRAQENQQNIALQMRADSLQLKQDIYTAYQNAINAMATWQARQKTLRTAEYSYSLGRQRYEVGLLPVIELITLQTNVQRATIDALTARYDYVFRTKILEFYRGNAVGL
ncbi:MAG TPA: TolC family protein, partial [Phnomibacter sp.]|nr:TolC family protein [Phnomibacter sp.]